MSTIAFPETHSPVEDAQAMRKACQGLGTDEKAIISLLGRRNATQRKQIREEYQNLFKEDLVKRLEHELKGDFERAVYRWILDPEDRDAVLLNVAITKKPVDYRVIVEIASSQLPEELLGTKRAYQSRYKCSVEEDLAHHTRWEMRKLLVGLVSTYRYRGDEINGKLAAMEADVLYNAIKGKNFQDDEVIRIITTRSKPQFLATFNRYRDDHDSSITKHLKDVPSADYLSALDIAMRCLTDHQKYFEKVLRVAIDGGGSDKESLTRVVVTRAEKDLLHIKELFYRRKSVHLGHAVANVTAGDYEDFLVTLIGN